MEYEVDNYQKQPSVFSSPEVSDGMRNMYFPSLLFNGWLLDVAGMALYFVRGFQNSWWGPQGFNKLDVTRSLVQLW